jgi:predicted phosphodiesterase
MIDKYSIRLAKHSISLELVAEKLEEFELRLENQITTQSFSFAVLADTQGRNDIFELMVDDINANEPDFVLHCGDMTTMGTVEQFEEFLTVSNKLDAPLFTTAGNHDIKGSNNNYVTYFGTSDYSFQVGDCRFITLDSSTQDLTTEQLTWLEQVSGNQNTDLEKILFTHVPPFSSQLPGHLYLDPDVPEKLMEILENNEFKYCFSGHLHLFNYTERDGIKYITTGGGGAAPYAPGELGGFRHFVFVEVEDNVSEFQVVRFDDEQFKNETINLELNGALGKINLDLNDLITFEHLEGASACQNQYSNWVGNGTYKGVEVKTLVELVGGMNKNDTLLVRASDGYYQEFAYENVYLNESWLNIQGPLVLSYEYDGENPPDWSDGLRLITIPMDGEYSLEDCKQTSMPGQGYWEYQSAGARWVKNVVSIVVVSG